MSVSERVGEVRDRIAAAAAPRGRDPASITLVAATKTVDVARVQQVVDAGVVDVGENRAQELLSKTTVHGARGGTSSGSSSATRCASSRRGSSAGSRSTGSSSAPRSPAARPAPACWWRSTWGRSPRRGDALPTAVPALVDALLAQGLDVAGLMAVPPHDDDPRRWFTQLREQAAALGLTELSMGMTDDFEVAVEEGATMVRVGRALFGPRA